jgi:serine/threonine protein kinase
MSRPLLDHRYAVDQLLVQTMYEQHYSAFHVELGIPVRLVVVPSPADERLADVQRFRRIATQVASLRHPALPRLRDYFTIPGSPTGASPAMYYVVFDALEGIPFSTYLVHRRGRSLCEALVYGLQLTDALDLVDRRTPGLLPEVVLSPDTLQVRSYAHIGVAELGVARWLVPTLCRYATPEAKLYLAPEIVAGEAGDSRSSIYSIAAFLHHALVGTPPAVSGLRLDEFVPAIPTALDRVVGQALNPDPSVRYQSLDQFGRELGQAALAVLPEAMALTPRSRQRSMQKVSVLRRSALPQGARYLRASRETVRRECSTLDRMIN